MGFVSEACKEQIRARVPLEELLREYNVALTPVGKRLRALCPFHAEKTASFYVDTERQTYHCFGCQEHGDAFSFIQKTHQVDFPQALELLARRAGVTLDNEPSGSRGESRQSLVRFYDVLDLAREFYQDFLREDPGARPAREYLIRRGIERPTWDRFHLGYSPPEWDALCGHAARRGIPAEILEAVGLARRREHAAGHYDYFRGRVMFPVADPQGRTIGFGARTLGDDVPKYLNSPKTPVFDKSQVLYALSEARTGIQRAGMIAIVEGYTDAIVAHQAGLDFFVASLGTAFTRENARRLGRLAPRVLLIFDGDAAGQKATERSLDLLVAESVDVRIYTVTDGKDPCDAILALGAEEFRRRIQSESVGIFEFKWRRTVESPAAKDAGAAIRARALDEFLELLAKVPNVVARKLILREFSERIGLPEEDIAARMRELSRRSTRFQGRPGGPAPGGPRPDASRGPAPRDGEWRIGRSDSKTTQRETEHVELAASGQGSEAARGSTSPPVAGVRAGTTREPQPPVVTPRSRAEPGPGVVGGFGGDCDARSGADLGRNGSEEYQEPGQRLDTRTHERQGKLEELILECCLAQPEHAESLLGGLPRGFFQDAVLAGVIDRIGTQLARGAFSPSRIVHELDSQEASSRVEALLRRVRDDEGRFVADYDEVRTRLLRDLWRHLRLRHLEELRTLISRQRAGGRGAPAEDTDTLRALRREYFDALKELKKGGGAGPAELSELAAGIVRSAHEGRDPSLEIEGRGAFE